MSGFISEADAAVLLAARDVLNKLDRAATDGAWQLEAAVAMRRGRFSEASKSAATAIFEALNVAHAYLQDEVAKSAIHAMVTPDAGEPS
jgi:hypothetical protein